MGRELVYLGTRKRAGFICACQERRPFGHISERPCLVQLSSHGILYYPFSTQLSGV